MTTNKELKKVLDDFNREYKAKSEESREAYIRHLPAGQAVPPKGRIYGDENKAAFTKLCLEKRAQVRDIIGKEIDSLRSKMAEAPTTEAVNSVQLLKMRDNVSEEEISTLLDKYGDNNQVRSALVDIASAHGYHSFSRSGDEERLKDIEGLQNSLENSLSIKSMEDKGEAYASWLGCAVDNLFPEE